MKTKRAGTRAVLQKLGQSADHSTLFHWMVEHHDSMVASANGGRIRWTDLCVTFTQLGLKTREGEPPDERNSRQTWYRVRKVVAEKRARTARAALTGLAPRSLMPSASPRARTPIETTRPSSSAAPTIGTPLAIPLPRTGSDAPTGAGGPISDEQVAAKKARMMRTLAERSGR